MSTSAKMASLCFDLWATTPTLSPSLSLCASCGTTTSATRTSFLQILPNSLRPLGFCHAECVSLCFCTCVCFIGASVFVYVFMFVNMFQFFCVYFICFYVLLALTTDCFSWTLCVSLPKDALFHILPNVSYISIKSHNHSQVFFRF